LFDNLENSTVQHSGENSMDILFRKFESPVKFEKKLCLTNFKENSIHDSIDYSVGNVLDELVSRIVENDLSLTDSKNVPDLMKSIENFLINTNFGTFDYSQKTGKNILKVKHCMGANGNIFCEKFFKKLFELCLTDYTMHVISNENFVCVIFR